MDPGTLMMASQLLGASGSSGGAPVGATPISGDAKSEAHATSGNVSIAPVNLGGITLGKKGMTPAAMAIVGAVGIVGLIIFAKVFKK